MAFCKVQSIGRAALPSRFRESRGQLALSTMTNETRTVDEMFTGSAPPTGVYAVLARWIEGEDLKNLARKSADAAPLHGPSRR